MISQREAADQAGLSKDQQVTAVRVANVPQAEFEALIETDAPPTITELAERGKQSRGMADMVERYGPDTSSDLLRERSSLHRLRVAGRASSIRHGEEQARAGSRSQAKRTRCDRLRSRSKAR